MACYAGNGIVVAGFLGGTGWVLITAGIAQSLPGQDMANLFSGKSLLYWVPCVSLAGLMYYLGISIKNTLLLPLLMLSATLIFWGLSWVFGISPAQLTASAL